MLRLRGGGNWGPGPDACGDGKEGNGAEGRRGPAWRRRASGAGKDRMGWGWGDDWGTDLKDSGQENTLLSSHSSSRRKRGKEEEEFGPSQGRKGRTGPDVPTACLTTTPTPTLSPLHLRIRGCEHLFLDAQVMALLPFPLMPPIPSSCGIHLLHPAVASSPPPFICGFLPLSLHLLWLP